MTDTAAAPADDTGSTDTTSVSNEQAVADAVAQDKGDFTFVLDKYRADGRSDQDAAMEQAKGYTELHNKFGAFTGAPEEYELALSTEMSERVDLEEYKDDPLISDFKEMAKEMGINNEAANKFLEFHFKTQLAGEDAMGAVRDEEMKKLGDNAEGRVNNVSDWAKANLDAENSTGLIDSLTSASAVQAVEAIIAKTRNTGQLLETTTVAAVSHEKLQEMLHAKDEFGNDKMNNKEYAANVNKLYDQQFGADQKTTVG